MDPEFPESSEWECWAEGKFVSPYAIIRDNNIALEGCFREGQGDSTCFAVLAIGIDGNGVQENCLTVTVTVTLP